MSSMSDPMKQEFAAHPGEQLPPGVAPTPKRTQSGTGKALAVTAAVLVSFAVGLAAGVFFMGLMGYHLSEPPAANAAPPPGGSPPGAPMMGAPPGMGSAPGMGRGPNPKAQLSGLVGKLDVLTEKPLAVQLTADQRKQVQEQLKGLADAEELSDDDAKTKLEKLLDVVKDQKDTLEAAGYRWPGAGGPPGMGQPSPPNPFKMDANAKHLKAFSERLEKSGN